MGTGPPPPSTTVFQKGACQALGKDVAGCKTVYVSKDQRKSYSWTFCSEVDALRKGGRGRIVEKKQTNKETCLTFERGQGKARLFPSPSDFVL